jgi:hypothetical protein
MLLPAGARHSFGSRGLSIWTDRSPLLARPLHGIIPTWDATLTTNTIPLRRASRTRPRLRQIRLRQRMRDGHVLHKDLPNAVKHLRDEELDRLLAVTLAEAKRRGRQTTPTYEPSLSRKVEAAGSLTRGQLNAVRAAFKAGITPARIARQFGLSQSDVRTALKSHTGE